MKAGLLDSSSKQNKKVHDQYKTLIQKAIKYNLSNQKDLLTLSPKISPEYLSILVFQTDKKYISLFKKDNLCRLGELLYNDLVKPSEKVIFEISINGKKEFGFLKKNDAINYIKSLDKCSKIGDYASGMAKEKLKKTIELLGLKNIGQSNLCQDVFKRLNQSSYRPYLCGLDYFFEKSAIALSRIDTDQKISFKEKSKLINRIQKSQVLKNELSPFEIGLLRNYCTNLENEKKFCSNYLIKDIWLASLNGEFPKNGIKYRCQQLLSFIPNNNKSYQQCVKTLSKKPDYCISMGAKEYPALFPKPDCKENSNALAVGNLEFDYQDCPGSLDNLLFVHGARITNHLKNTHEKFPNLNCKDVSEKIYSNLAFETDPDSWPLKICYADPLNSSLIDLCINKQGLPSCEKYRENKPSTHPQSIEKITEKFLKSIYGETKSISCIQGEKKQTEKLLFRSSSNCVIIYDEINCDSVKCPRTFYFNKKQISILTNGKAELTCMKYIPGEDESLPFSESRVIQKAVSRMHPGNKERNCKIVDKKNYKPLLLKFQVGCHLIKDSSCDDSCQPKVIINGKELGMIRYRGNFEQNILFLSTEDKGMTLDKVLEQSLEYYPTKLMSLSNLKFHLNLKNAIAYGTGCMEDLIPKFYSRTSINQCTPAPFIIDGYKTENFRDYLTVRTVFDEVGSPRFIIWNKVFNSLKMFQSIHPRKEWTLYGIK
jgi:hypothetical protein